MCDGAMISKAGLGAQALGGIGQTYAAYKGAQGTREGYSYQAAVLRNNALLAEWQAQDAMSRGATKQNAIQLRAGQIRGRQEAIIASRNIALTEGSALNLLADTEFGKARDVATARDETAMEVWAIREQARGNLSNADMLDYRASGISPMLEAGGTALTAAGKVASSWYAMRDRAAGTTTARPYSFYDTGEL